MIAMKNEGGNYFFILVQMVQIMDNLTLQWEAVLIMTPFTNKFPSSRILEYYSG